MQVRLHYVIKRGVTLICQMFEALLYVKKIEWHTLYYAALKKIESR